MTIPEYIDGVLEYTRYMVGLCSTSFSSSITSHFSFYDGISVETRLVIWWVIYRFCALLGSLR